MHLQNRETATNVRANAAVIVLFIVVILAISGVIAAFLLQSRTTGDSGESTSPIRTGQQASGKSPGEQTPHDAPPGSQDDTPLPTIATGTSQDARDRLNALTDPTKDGWDTEYINNVAGSQLKALGKLLEHPEDIDAGRLGAICSPEYAGGPLRPGPREETFSDDLFTMHRFTGGPVDDQSYRGLEGLERSMRELLEFMGDAENRYHKFKIVRVNLDGDRATTKALFEFAGHTDGHAAQLKAMWETDWVLAAGEDPRLLAIRVEWLDEVTTKVAGGRWFADCTRSILEHNESFDSQLVWGMNDWVRRIERIHMMDVFARFGGAVADVNGDGREDLYLCAPGGVPNRLFIQNADGTADDVSQSAGVDFLDHTSSALFLDIDNDGDSDLVLGMKLGVILLENDGTGAFTMRARLPVKARDVQSMCAADYDNDGDIDLYVCSDFSNDFAGTGFIYHDANDGGPNILFRNDLPRGDTTNWIFTDITDSVGLDENNTRHSLAAAWEDFDGDGDQDLYVANDYGRNSLYRNDGGVFTDIAPLADVVDYGSGMSVSWGDVDRNGTMDLYVANMWSSAGNRVTTQSQFMADADDETKNLYKRFAKGNSLFRNLGDGTFADIGDDMGVEVARWAWSSLFADINNDGWEDLLVANGYITTEDSGDL